MLDKICCCCREQRTGAYCRIVRNTDVVCLMLPLLEEIILGTVDPDSCICLLCIGKVTKYNQLDTEQEMLSARIMTIQEEKAMILKDMKCKSGTWGMYRPTCIHRLVEHKFKFLKNKVHFSVSQNIMIIILLALNYRIFSTD